jgi:hypothetical protein
MKEQFKIGLQILVRKLIRKVCKLQLAVPIGVHALF